MKKIALAVIFSFSIPAHGEIKPIELNKLNDERNISLALKACLIGYAISGDRSYISSINSNDGKNLASIVPHKKIDARKIRRFAGSKVKICGDMRIEKDCWSKIAVCAPYQKPINLLYINSIRAME